MFAEGAYGVDMVMPGSYKSHWEMDSDFGENAVVSFLKAVVAEI